MLFFITIWELCSVANWRGRDSKIPFYVALEFHNDLAIPGSAWDWPNTFAVRLTLLVFLFFLSRWPLFQEALIHFVKFYLLKNMPCPERFTKNNIICTMQTKWGEKGTHQFPDFKCILARVYETWTALFSNPAVQSHPSLRNDSATCYRTERRLSSAMKCDLWHQWVWFAEGKVWGGLSKPLFFPLLKAVACFEDICSFEFPK